MIIKSFELNKINLDKHKIILLYGNNEGFKSSVIESLTKHKGQLLNYDEKEVLSNSDIFLEEISNNSLFENEKCIHIKRASDKLIKIIEEIDIRNFKDLNIFINSENLERKSKLRNFFEKNTKHICIPFYPDNNQTLSRLTVEHLKKRNILVSQSKINQIINAVNGDRKNLLNELEKIEQYTKNGKKLTEENIEKLINLSENHSISQLIDNCLAKDINKTKKILNENIFTNEDCLLILRTFLNKSKKLIELLKTYEKNNNIESTISSAKPPIFWKDKEITKKQLKNWNTQNLKNLIYNLIEIELTVKKNLNNSLNTVTDFLLKQSSFETNNLI